MDERARDGQNPGRRNKRSLDQLDPNAHAAAAAKKIRIDLGASSAAQCMYECNGNFQDISDFRSWSIFIAELSDDGRKSESSGSVDSRDMLRIAIPLLHPRT